MKEAAHDRVFGEEAEETKHPHTDGEAAQAGFVQGRGGETLGENINSPENGRAVELRYHLDKEKSAVDTERLFEDVRGLLNSREVLDLAKSALKGSRTRRDGDMAITELDAEGFRALKKLAKRLPRGIPLKPEVVLSWFHTQNEAGLHFVLNRIVLPNTLGELRARLPETFKVRGIRYHVPGLHKRLEQLSRENEELILSVIEAMGGIYALFGIEPVGVRA